MAIFEIQNLTYYYPDEIFPSLNNINLQIQEGEFVLLMGTSGSGKSSLLKAMAGLLPDYYGGKIGGEILCSGASVLKGDKRSLAQEVGMIFQDPEKQMIMTGVRNEIAFGLENINIPYEEINRRIAEILSLLGLTGIADKNTFNLSGGEKQKVALASVLVMYPRVLLLDEPTSQLDPMAAQDLLSHLQRLNQEWGMTVVLVEQRIDRCLHLADKIIFMEGGRTTQSDSREMINWITQNYPIYAPPISRFLSNLECNIPLTLKEGREHMKSIEFLDMVFHDDTEESMEEILKLSDISLSYDRRNFVVKDIDIKISKGSVSVILGENGAGKTSLLKSICGLIKPVKGNIVYKGKNITKENPEKISNNIAYLSQNPNDYLYHDTVEEEVNFNLKIRGIRDDKRIEEVLTLLKLEDKRQKNPRDLSGGERQRVALATLLVLSPEVILLDEPTRGLDPELKHQLGDLFKILKNQGMGILVVTHDVEFAAEISDRVMIMSQGKMVAQGSKRDILTNSLYYAPQINRLFKGINDKVLSIEEAQDLVKGRRV